MCPGFTYCYFTSMFQSSMNCEGVGGTSSLCLYSCIGKGLNAVRGQTRQFPDIAVALRPHFHCYV